MLTSLAIATWSIGVNVVRLFLHKPGCMQGKNYIFTTEGHVIPILKEFHDKTKAPLQLQQMAQQPPTPMQSAPPVQTVILTPDQP